MKTKTIYLSILACLFCTSVAFSQNNINISGSHVKKTGGYLVIKNGSITNDNATVKATDGTTIIKGDNNTANSSIGGNQPTVFHNLNINKTNNDVQLDTNITIANTLMLNGGLLDLKENNLTIADTATITGMSNTKYIKTSGVGRLVRSVGATNILFPVGNTKYKPVTLNNIGTKDTFKVSVQDIAYTDSKSAVANADMVNTTWNVSEAKAGGSDVTMTVQWETADELSNFDRSNASLLSVDAEKWVRHTNQSASNTNPHTLTESNVTQFSKFGVADSDATIVECGNTIYVNASATGNNTGESWANAFTSLQSALESHCGKAEIWVAKGTYYPSKESDGTTDSPRFYNFYIYKDGLKIYGGFKGTETTLAERNITDNETILSGDIGTLNDNSDNVYHVVYVDGKQNDVTKNTVLDGFTITHGNANGTGATADGGGFYIDGFGSSVTCSPTFSNCKFANNNAGFSGGGGLIFTNSGTVQPTFNNCTFNHNTAALGGAITILCNNATGNSTFNNCLFYKNTVSHAGGAIFNNGDNSNNNTSFTNCTFASNTATASGGVWFDRAMNGTGESKLTNCIFWSNGNTPFSEETGTTASFVINHSIYDDGTINSSVTLPNHITGSNNLDANPSFGDITIDDYRIKLGSPAIDAGDNTAWTATNLTADMLGTARPYNGTVDLGAYENNGQSLPSLPVELLYFYAEKAGENVRLDWQTATELNNSHFDVEWSTDGIRFDKIGEVAGAGTTNDVQFYDFLHENPANGENYYRLRQVDFDGKYEYTDILNIEYRTRNIEYRIYPNPAAHFLKIESEDLIGEMVQVFNINGQLVKEFQHQSALTNLPITNLPNGTYFIKVGQEVKKLIIQK